MENIENPSALADFLAANLNLKIDEKQTLLMTKILKSLNKTELFGKNDLEELEEVNFSNKDFYDLLNYATSFMAKSKMIEVYLNKEA